MKRLLAISILLSATATVGLNAQTKGGLKNAEVRGGYRANVISAPDELAASFENLKPKAMLYQPVDSDRDKLPLVISLHGSGGGRRDIEKRGKWIGTIRELQKPENQSQQAMLLTPQSDGTWSPASLEKMLGWLLSEYPQIDENRIYCVGYSMGGKGTWEWAMHKPDRFAAIIPKGFIPDLSKAEAMVDLPIWAMVGDRDTRERVEGIPAMAKKLKDLGSTKVKITVFPGANHASATKEIKQLEGVYEWLFSHSKDKN